MGPAPRAAAAVGGSVVGRHRRGRELCPAGHGELDRPRRPGHGERSSTPQAMGCSTGRRRSRASAHLVGADGESPHTSKNVYREGGDSELDTYRRRLAILLDDSFISFSNFLATQLSLAHLLEMF